MQLELPFLRAAPPDPAIDFVRTRRAKRYILRVRPDGSLRVTIPRGGSRAEALRFVEAHLHWILEERLRLPERRATQRWTDGSSILLDGQAVTLRVCRDATGDESTLTLAGRTIAAADGAADLRPAIEAVLRTIAQESLPPRVHELAARHGLCVARVSIRNQRTRWGSCSRSGCIALNFRLVQMPPDVRDYILIHELMHLKEQNHGRRFWRLVAEACPGYRAAERWLRTEGRTLIPVR